MDGRCGQDAERFITPTWRGSTITVAPHEYLSRARQLDGNYNVIERDAQRVRLRLDYPGAGLADATELMCEMHFASILRYGTHPGLRP